MVGEPSVEDTIAILRGLKERYEVHHDVRIQDSALIAAATLSRPLHRRPLPAGQGDRPDRRGGLALRIEIDSLPTEIDEVDRRVMQLEIELTSLRKEKDDASEERREAIERELAELQERSAAMKAQWQKREGGDPGASPSSRSSSSRRAVEAERAEREADLSAPPSSLRRDPRARDASSPSTKSSERERAARAARVPQGGGRRGRRRRGRRALDRHPGQPPARGRDREADPHGGAPARARGRPGRGDRGGRDRAAPLARRAAGPRPPDRLVPVPRPDRRRQDRARARAGRVHVRLPGGDDPDRHVRVHGEALGLAPGRRAARATSATRRAAS